LTAEELWRLPDDGLRHELIDGELTTMAPSASEHGLVAGNEYGSLFVHLQSRNVGRVFAAETGFLLARDPDLVRAPDMAFVRSERAEAVGRVRGYWPSAPDLAVEVVSPNDRPGEVAEKVRTWLAHGARLVLVVYPDERRVRVHLPGHAPRERSEADTLDSSAAVPGWAVPVRVFFE
jgi:Uma2 family endonuclease